MDIFETYLYGINTPAVMPSHCAIHLPKRATPQFFNHLKPPFFGENLAKTIPKSAVLPAGSGLEIRGEIELLAKEWDIPIGMR